MKPIKILCLALVGAFVCSTSAYSRDIFSIKTAATTPIALESCAISVAAGETLEFSAWDLERRIGLAENSLQGITVTALPQSAQGGVFLDGVEVERYDFLSRAEIDRLVYVPGDGAAGATVTFVPQGSDAVTTSLSIQVLQTPNAPPEVEPLTVETVENVPIRGHLNVFDPEGDPVRLQVVQQPQKGEVALQGQSFTYTPYTDRTGTDTFTVCAVDSHYNYSSAAAVEVYIGENHNAFTYADMGGNPSQYAAVRLREKGVYTGTAIGDRHFLQPDRQMTRGELLVVLLSAADLEEGVKPTVNTGLPNDSSLPMWLKPYVKKAVDEGILPPGQSFAHQEIPTRAEAVVLTDRVAGISDVREYPLTMSDAGDIPDWARSSYVDLAAYKMLDLHDGAARPAGALTISYGVDLAWQLWKHCHR